MPLHESIKIKQQHSDHVFFFLIAVFYNSYLYFLNKQDWHFCKNFPDTPVYETPIYFSVDWLNEYWILGQKDDYRFVYIGPKGSW